MRAEELSKMNQWHGWLKDVEKGGNSIIGMNQIEGHLQLGAVVSNLPPCIICDTFMVGFNTMNIDAEFLELCSVCVRELIQQFICQVIIVQTQTLQKVEVVKFGGAEVNDAVVLAVFLDTGQVERLEAGAMFGGQFLQEGTAVDQKFLDTSERQVFQFTAVLNQTFNQVQVPGTQIIYGVLDIACNTKESPSADIMRRCRNYPGIQDNHVSQKTCGVSDITQT